MSHSANRLLKFTLAPIIRKADVQNTECSTRSKDDVLQIRTSTLESADVDCQIRMQRDIADSIHSPLIEDRKRKSYVFSMFMIYGRVQILSCHCSWLNEWKRRINVIAGIIPTNKYAWHREQWKLLLKWFPDEFTVTFTSKLNIYKNILQHVSYVDWCKNHRSSSSSARVRITSLPSPMHKQLLRDWDRLARH